MNCYEKNELSKLLIVTNGRYKIYKDDSNLNYEGRLITKSGVSNISTNPSRFQLLRNLRYTNLVAAPWTHTLLIFLITITLTWFTFGCLYFLISYSHADFDLNHLPNKQKESNFTPCIYQVESFSACLLFSFETLFTVGYGVKATTDECPEAIFVNAAQCMLGFMMQGFMGAVIFAKATLPELRSKTLLISKRAVISYLDNNLYFMFRIGDMRKNHVIDVKVKCFLIQSKQTLEGEILKYNVSELALEFDGYEKGLFFNWPITMQHKIDSSSPMFNISPKDLLKQKFEVVVILEGTIECTGQMTQAKMSYLPREIIWGKVFQPMLKFDKYRNQYEADFDKFDKLTTAHI